MGKMNVAYMRVSTEAQTEKYGLDVQRDKIQDLADKNNAKIERWYVDGGYSGSNIDRPEMQRLLDDARDGKISSVYVYKLDRMSRDAIDTLTLLYRTLPKYGVKIESVTEELRFETPMDKVMVGVNAIMGQYEREVIYMRTRAGMVERVKKGLWMGGGNQPYGYYYDRNDGILHPKEDEAENVRRMFEMYNSGMSCRSISEILGIKCEKVVRDVLRRKSNIGYIEYNGVLYKGLHEPIVDEDVFWNTQELIERRSNNYYLANKHILSGLCFCGKCGAKMRYKMWGSYFILECYSREGTKKNMVKSSHCDNKRNKASYIEKEVTDCFKKFIINVEPNSDRSENKELVKNEIKKSNESFFNEIQNRSSKQEAHNPMKVFEEVFSVIEDRKEHPKEGSYTNYLFDKGIDKILKKVGEEATEIVIAAKNPNPNEIKYEIADFLYHMMVLMAEKGVTWEEVTTELANR